MSCFIMPVENNKMHILSNLLGFSCCFLFGEQIGRWQRAISLLLFLQAMVQYNRIELLNHPVCKKYLAMKWCVLTIQPLRATISHSDALRPLIRLQDRWFVPLNAPDTNPLFTLNVILLTASFFVLIHRIAYGSTAHLLNMFLYLLGLLPLTHLIVTLRPTMNTTVLHEQSLNMVPISFIEVLMTAMISINAAEAVLAYVECIWMLNVAHEWYMSIFWCWKWMILPHSEDTF